MPSKEVLGLHPTDLIPTLPKITGPNSSRLIVSRDLQYSLSHDLQYYSSAFSNLKCPRNTSDSVSKVRVATGKVAFHGFH